MDDIALYSRTLKKHEEHMRVIFGYMREHKLYPKAPKCMIFVQELDFVGYWVTAKGVLTRVRCKQFKTGSNQPT